MSPRMPTAQANSRGGNHRPRVCWLAGANLLLPMALAMTLAVLCWSVPTEGQGWPWPFRRQQPSSRDPWRTYLAKRPATNLGLGLIKDLSVCEKAVQPKGHNELSSWLQSIHSRRTGAEAGDSDEEPVSPERESDTIEDQLNQMTCRQCCQYYMYQDGVYTAKSVVSRDMAPSQSCECIRSNPAPAPAAVEPETKTSS